MLKQTIGALYSFLISLKDNSDLMKTLKVHLKDKSL